MALDHYPRGVLVPALTPFRSDLSVDEERFVEHCRWLLSEGADGLAVFGTTSEANSLSISERMRLLDRLIERGIEPSVLMPGTGCCALPDTITLTRHAVEHNCFGVLMLPPFYYKGVSDDGIFASIAEVAQRLADDRLRIYLYHIPPMAGVGFSLAVIERLLRDYPRIVVGIKDSSGDWNNTRAMLERFQPRGFDVFAGSEVFLLGTLRAGGAGCISATANVNPGRIAQLARAWQDDDATARQAALDAVRMAFQKFPMIPALKAAVAHFSGDAAYATVRPPLVALTSEQRTQLLAALEPTGFSMPGIERA